MTQATWLFTTAWRRQTEREEHLREQGENNGEIKETSQQEEKNNRWRDGDNYERREIIFTMRSESYKISIYVTRGAYSQMMSLFVLCPKYGLHV